MLYILFNELFFAQVSYRINVSEAVAWNTAEYASTYGLPFSICFTAGQYVT